MSHLQSDSDARCSSETAVVGSGTKTAADYSRTGVGGRTNETAKGESRSGGRTIETARRESRSAMTDAAGTPMRSPPRLSWQSAPLKCVRVLYPKTTGGESCELAIAILHVEAK